MRRIVRILESPINWQFFWRRRRGVWWQAFNSLTGSSKLSHAMQSFDVSTNIAVRVAISLRELLQYGDVLLRCLKYDRQNWLLQPVTAIIVPPGGDLPSRTETSPT
jgi:hypothetical protein